MNKRRSEARRILLLSALAITIFTGIPRLVIISYLKAKSYPGIDNISWWDLAQKSLYCFGIAYLFLWLNVSGRKIITKVGILDMTRARFRLAVNVVLYFIIRFISLKLNLYGSGAAVSEKVAGFMFNISLLLEISFCILIAAIYRLLVNNQHVNIHIADECLAGLLPPMSVQILLENAIKHNVVSARMPLVVTIETEKGRLIVSNRLREKKVKEPSTGTGLHNLNQRYNYLCNHGIDIDKVDGLFVVSLPLLRIANNGITYKVI